MFELLIKAEMLPKGNFSILEEPLTFLMTEIMQPEQHNRMMMRQTLCVISVCVLLISDSNQMLLITSSQRMTGGWRFMHGSVCQCVCVCCND